MFDTRQDTHAVMLGNIKGQFNNVSLNNVLRRYFRNM